MLLVPTSISKNRFIVHRFLTDAIGHFMGSYVIAALSTGIDPHSDRPTDFPHAFALTLAASYIASDLLVAWFFGNSKWFGLVSLVAASLAACVLFCIGQAVYDVAIISVDGVPDFGAAMILFVAASAVFLIPAIVFAMIARLMAWPIVAYFWPRE